MNNKPTLLVVEDEPINRKILAKILSDSYELVEAPNGEVAIHELQQNAGRFAAMLLDIVMPVMNGYAVLGWLRNANMAELPVIVMTGDSDDEAEQKALDAGAWDFVNKPFNARVLASRLRNAIARSQLAVYEKMQYVAEHDRLTGLYNRSKLFLATRELLAAHPGEKFAFVRADIDHFALYNQSFGEEAGDELLRHLAGIISGCATVYPYCTYGRIAGDIFCTCLPFDGDEQKLTTDAEYLQQALAAYRKDYAFEISVGVCVVDDPSLSIEELYIRAGLAAAKCKNQFEKHIAFYDAESGKAAARAALITSEMQTALDKNHFLVYYQPKVNLNTDAACGAEALVRWLHPVRGLISPGEFIPVFESNGFIARLDYYVWERTCQDLRRWCDEGLQPFPVSVNISRISLYNPQLVSQITGLVEKYHIPPALLQLEVTESAYMTNPDLMEGTIRALREAGFTILMDDFGSGYSSLNTLKRIEMDVLKIDMKFLPVKNAIERAETEKAEIILASIIKMANWLGMSVVVEGVETKEQRDFLEGTGCDCVQGYYYSRPIPVQEYEQTYLRSCSLARVEVPTPRATVSPRHNVTILVIDDVELDRDLLVDYFCHDYHVHTCASAEDALLYLKRNKNKVRLILVDNMMPGMSGLDFLIYCQTNSVLRTIPQIMITADNNTEAQLAAFKAGAYDYITKPLTKEIVMARVNHVMDISRQFRSFDAGGYDFRSLAERDKDTGLLNKSTLLDLTEHVLASEPDDLKALLVMDIDNFKMVNDRYGHLNGDVALHCLADELTRTFRKSDLVGRFGGDEFVVLMNALPETDTVRRKVDALIRTYTIRCAKEYNLSTSVSVGIAVREEGDTSKTLFARADQALYEAKSSGKAKAIVYGEKVPPIRNDDKPVVLICGDNPQLYPAIALAYGDGAAFAIVSNLTDLKAIFAQYRSRIHAICMDMQMVDLLDSKEFYQFILQQGGGKTIPILAVCKEGDMHQLRAALKMNVQDFLTLPPQMDVIQRRISQALMLGCL